ncbi:tRNA pseudouridine(55) synthase TruB [Pseudomonas fluvialis]|jgi:tRNA pseudouridine55 synthase|uniref:tRNA pseudouridine synthase B n=1 Tax=Pseudomonas fluvialis TaxID=1793966 RepID=A0A2I0CLZ5_9PSED|nr:tRNA pseudouridine(55) synthase TruB [Pseudomonas pharmacofabricae]PKF70176.1 tRNA pseudouridine(55) synthase TruB [Pseudomonas pharmacofabricae]
MAQVKRVRRQVNGVLVLDKPRGMSSNQALQKVRWLLNAEKAGHTGSLDPLATGVLPLCFGEATKFSQYLLDADKGYETLAQLGVTTTTGDAEGEVLERRPVALTAEQIEAALQGFRGPIQQIPPMYSALKKDGQPLYKLARAGEVVEREARSVTIARLELLAWQGEQLRLAVDCSKGTYIRTLVEDLGQQLGCGAHVAELRRTQAGPFSLAQAVSLEALEAAHAESGSEALDAFLLPVDSGLQHWPLVELSAHSAYYWLHGQPVRAPGAPAFGLLRVVDEQGRFIGIGEVSDDGRLAPRRLIRSE